MGNIIRKSAYLRLLLPAVLTAVLVYDGLAGYSAPNPFDGIEVTAQPAYAAEAPELETVEQEEAPVLQPQGTAGKLAAVRDPGNYKDGTYTGSARGFGGTITVRVTIKDGKIASVSIVSAPGETGSFLSRAKAVAGRIVKKQSTNVDAVSGATYSSNGIIKAVRKALAKAAGKKSAEDKKSPSKEKKEKKRKPEKPESVTEGSWLDGTYTGEGEGFSGKLHVEVVIKDGRIVSVRLLDSKDDKSFMDKAKKGILKTVTDKQSTDVDAVSGATFSSYGLLEAINDALKKASPPSDSGDDGKDEPEETEPSEIESRTCTAWVLYDDDEDFDDYQLTVTFTEEGGKIKSISDYSQTGPATNNPYIRMAVQGINKQLSAGADTSEIDAVTGATCTSSSIIEMMAGIMSEKRADPHDEEGTGMDKTSDAEKDNKGMNSESSADDDKQQKTDNETSMTEEAVPAVPDEKENDDAGGEDAAEEPEEKESDEEKTEDTDVSADAEAL